MALIDNSAGRRVDIPHEPGEWMELRPLTWPDIERAKKARQSAVMKDIGETVGSMGADLLKQMQGLSSGDVQAAEADPLTQMDMMTVLTMGVVGWSYPAEVTMANIERLDQTTAEWAAREIIQPQSAEQRKNLSNGSTDTSTVMASRPMSG